MPASLWLLHLFPGVIALLRAYTVARYTCVVLLLAVDASCRLPPPPLPRLVFSSSLSAPDANEPPEALRGRAAPTWLGMLYSRFSA